MNNPDVTVRAESTVVTLWVTEEVTDKKIPTTLSVPEALDLIAKLSVEITKAVEAGN